MKMREKMERRRRAKMEAKMVRSKKESSIDNGVIKVIECCLMSHRLQILTAVEVVVGGGDNAWKNK